MIGTADMLTAAGALALAMLVGNGPAQAQLGNGVAAIGPGGAAIGAGTATTISEGTGASASRVAGNCVTSRTAYRTQTNSGSTTLQNFQLMPNTHLPVTHAAGCLIVEFSAMVWIGSPTERMIVRATIAGVGTAEPPTMTLGRPVAGANFETRSTYFVFPNVPAGTHTVRMEWRSETGGEVQILNRTLKVQYKP